jgi:sterol desaturase/sphingolipid hydroxylase (fatty acid hydroxylase superfamily)
MDIDLDTGKLLVFVGGLCLFFGLEALGPTRVIPQSKLSRLFRHGLMATFNTSLIRVLTFVPMLGWLVYIEQQGFGIVRWLGLSGPIEFALSIIVLDFFDYWWHRANHRVTFLWRFHKAHHSDTAIDVTTALRFHPGELLLSMLAKAVWVLLWGPSTFAWFLFEALVSFCSQAHHSNVDLPDSIEQRISKLWVTPRFHAKHHGIDRSFGDANFSTIFSFWDLIFNTTASNLSQAQMQNLDIGLPEGRQHANSLVYWLQEPLQPSNLHLVRRDNGTSL